MWQLLYTCGGLISFLIFAKETPKNWIQPDAPDSSKIFNWVLHLVVSAIMAYGWPISWTVLYLVSLRKK